jgi:hypothetical protein
MVCNVRVHKKFDFQNPNSKVSKNEPAHPTNEKKNLPCLLSIIFNLLPLVVTIRMVATKSTTTQKQT